MYPYCRQTPGKGNENLVSIDILISVHLISNCLYKRGFIFYIILLNHKVRGKANLNKFNVIMYNVFVIKMTVWVCHNNL